MIVNFQVKDNTAGFFRRLMRSIQGHGKRSALRILEKEANLFKNTLRDNILQQKLELAPLSPAYVAYKRTHGLDPRILVATKEYVMSFEVRPIKDGYEVGVPNRIHADTKLTMNQLARYLEYGTSRMPPRPHWAPTIDKFLAERLDIIVQSLSKELYKSIEVG